MMSLEKNMFDKYVTSWFSEYVDEHREDQELIQKLFDEFTCRNENETNEDYLEEGETVTFFLRHREADEIYTNLFGTNENNAYEDMPDTEEFLTEMIMDSMSEWMYMAEDYEFVKEFVSDMIYRMARYEHPHEFFEQIQDGYENVCSYSDIMDYTEVYQTHCNDMEEFREQLEIDMGTSIRCEKRDVRYAWICKLCYEEVAFMIGRYFFEDEF